MIITRINIRPQEEIERKRKYIEDMTKCPFCQETLQFSYDHDPDLQLDRMTESAECLHCQLKIRSDEYQIQ